MLPLNMNQAESGNNGKAAVTHEYIPLKPRRPPTSTATSLDRIQYYGRFAILRIVPFALVFLLGLLLGFFHPQILHIYARRPHTYHLTLLPPLLPPVPSSPLTAPYPNLPPPDEPIPNLVHYVYGLAQPSVPPEEFPYYAYLGMRSAVMNLDPEAVFFHCLTEPVGYWWDEIMSLKTMDGEPIVHIKRVRDVTHVGSKEAPITHFAHKADVLRLEILLKYGGIYLDIDTFILHPFSPYGLLLQDTVLAMEAIPEGNTILRGPGQDDEMRPKGLCNAIILARPEAKFIRTWLDAYEEFDAKKWADHSVFLPWKLAQVYPNQVTVLSDRTFFWPTWTQDHLRAVYDEDEYSFDDSGQLAYHLWESMERHYLRKLNPTTIDEKDTSFTKLARRFQAPSEEARWLRYIAQQQKMKAAASSASAAAAAAASKTSLSRIRTAAGGPAAAATTTPARFWARSSGTRPIPRRIVEAVLDPAS